MSINDWLQLAKKQLDNANIESARLESLLIAGMVLCRPKEWILANGDFELSRNQVKELNKLVDKRLTHYPLAYLLGYKEFYGHSFTVTPDVLIPRPETEELIEYIVDNAAKNSILLDMGTGSGCTAISAKLARPDLKITATDISARALNIASQNAQKLSANVEFIKSDLFASRQLRDTKYQTIIANLPYVPTDEEHSTNKEIEFEPRGALFSGTDGLDHYRKFLDEAKSHLSPGGIIIIEHDPGQFKKLSNISENAVDIKSVSDYVSLITFTK